MISVFRHSQMFSGWQKENYLWLRTTEYSFICNIYINIYVFTVCMYIFHFCIKCRKLDYINQSHTKNEKKQINNKNVGFLEPIRELRSHHNEVAWHPRKDRNFRGETTWALAPLWQNMVKCQIPYKLMLEIMFKLLTDKCGLLLEYKTPGSHRRKRSSHSSQILLYKLTLCVHKKKSRTGD